MRHRYENITKVELSNYNREIDKIKNTILPIRAA